METASPPAPGPGVRTSPTHTLETIAQYCDPSLKASPKRNGADEDEDLAGGDWHKGHLEDDHKSLHPAELQSAVEKQQQSRSSPGQQAGFDWGSVMIIILYNNTRAHPRAPGPGRCAC